ncbi:glycosyl transferase [Paraburkholderia steynii]|uniref:Glycosyl transferase n=1 Tax=Paraburkholderia steynii TaxID=1245441 RepID=A0A4R0XG56_9BURK|nr:glycosyl transferase [Paraburkholderia steynii]
MAIEHNGVFSVSLLLGIAAAACVGCAIILAVLLKTGLAWRLATDIPNERSLHERPTPRVGGWGVVPAVLAAMALATPHLWLIAVGALFLSAVSQIDDRRGLPARVRFAAHLATVVAVVGAYPCASPWWTLPVLTVLMVWLVNLYNFMDGADGLAGGMALFGFSGYALGAWIAPHHEPELIAVSAAIAGAAAGFLLFNFHPARVFLGDAGSIPLGFLAGALGYVGWCGDVWPIWFPAMCFAPFIGDASVTLARRLMRGEKFWQAHREHYYQRMVRSGVGHAGTAWAWYAVMVAGIALALIVLGRSPAVQWGTVAGWSAVLVVIGFIVDLRWRRFQSAPSQQSEV